MADLLQTLEWNDEDYSKAAKQWGSQFLMMPIIGAEKSLKYMRGLPGIRYKYALPSIEGHAQFAPYRSDRKSADTTNIIFRELETHLGNLRFDFEPNLYIHTVLGKTASSLGDGQANSLALKHVIAASMADTSEQLNNVLFTAKRNPNGDTTADLFDGWGTILAKELEAGNISVEKGNKFEAGKVTSSNAVDIFKEIERSCHPILRDTEKFIFCDPIFADMYNDAYLLTHAGISYNTKFNQAFVEGSNGKTTIVPLSNLANTRIMIVTPGWNMLYGYDVSGERTRFEIKRYEPWVLTIAAAMFFGCQFYSIDQRFLKIASTQNEIILS